MKHSHTTTLLLSLVLALCATAAMAQQEVEFNYNGRVHVAGSPFSGTGYFKFSLVAGSPRTTIWANDGTALDGSEPSSSIATTVTQGFFSVDIGDTSAPNMAALSPTFFNRDDKVYLRSWFSDGTHGFEQMHPDRRVVNPALLGTTSFGAIELYVNPDTGNDSFSGLTSETAKATIQAAWDALPGTIETSATIHLANGVYRESPLLAGRRVTGNGNIWLIGNPDNPLDVIVTGADESAPTTPVRARALTIRGVQAMIVQGITFQYTQDNALHIRECASVTVRDCVARFFGQFGIKCIISSYANISRVEIYGTTRVGDSHSEGVGVGSSVSSTIAIEYANIHDLATGLYLSQARTEPANVTITNCYNGMIVTNCAVAYCSEGIVISSCHYGVYASGNGVLANRTMCAFSDNIVNISHNTGSVEW